VPEVLEQAGRHSWCRDEVAEEDRRVDRADHCSSSADHPAVDQPDADRAT